jgi:hypothetical protein
MMFKDVDMRCRKKTWKQMYRWERKAFHRENEVRRLRGLPPKPKPKGEPVSATTSTVKQRSVQEARQAVLTVVRSLSRKMANGTTGRSSNNRH